MESTKVEKVEKTETMNESRNILVICNRIPPEQSATGRFAYYIAKELNKSNHVYVMTLSMEKPVRDEHVETFCFVNTLGKQPTVPAWARHGVGRFLFKCRSFSLAKFRQVRRKYFKFTGEIKSIRDRSLQFVKENHIDTIISVSNPFECHELAYEIVRRNPEINWYPYLMDFGRKNTSVDTPASLERQIFPLAKKIFVLPFVAEGDPDFSADFGEKIIALNLPVIPNTYGNTVRADRAYAKTITFVYAGLFYESIRNPKALLDLWLALPSNYVLKLYSSGCEHILEGYKNRLGDRLQMNGFVPESEVNRQVMLSDFAICIGNADTKQTPSKVYDLMGSGKPFVYFSQSAADMCLSELSLCPSALCLDYTNINIEQFTLLAEQNKGVVYTYDQVLAAMPERSIGAFVDRIQSIIHTDRQQHGL